MDSRKNIKSHSRSLEILLQGIEYELVMCGTITCDDDITVDFVTSDSRNVQPGGLFAAIRGTECDGHDFIAGAIAKGCLAVICEAGKVSREQLGDWSGVLIEVADSGRAYGLVAANYYGRPAEKFIFIGVTGTNGKTTVTFLLEHVLLHAGLRVGVIGTVSNRYVGEDGEKVVLPTRLTTPEALLLQQLLHEMVLAGVRYVIMEVSSHALMQNRIGNIRFNAAAFTNLSRDHLDYHASMEDYFSAKLKLFTEHMAADGIAVLPAGLGRKNPQSWFTSLATHCKKSCKKIIYWGDAEKADIRLLGYELRLDRTVLDVLLGDANKVKLCSQLVGRFNIDNILTVFGLSSSLGIDLDYVLSGMERAVGAPGRLERILDSTAEPLSGPVVFVDYAHSPDALKQVLSTVASLPHGELYCVFGCGGDRDRGKRPVMGEIASRFSDVVIITDDNPRTEDPDQIVNQILSGVNMSDFSLGAAQSLKKRKAGEKIVVTERDRTHAVRLAITSAGPEDVVLIAGKGHENYQLSIRGRRFLDDRLEAEKALSSWTLKRIAKSVRGEIPGSGNNTRLLGEVTTDSRRVTDNSIFVALKGEKYDGHEFAVQAVEDGAACLVVDKAVDFPGRADIGQIIVSDTLTALGDMAAYRRAQLKKAGNHTVIGITGSCGKTTVKEMTASILQRKWPEGSEYPEGCVLKTQGNFNNLIGLPLSLMPLSLTHRAAVMEMGMNQPGELRRLTEIADPDISCILNIYGAHLEGLQSIEGVARAKEELFAGTNKNGILVVNMDDQRVVSLARKYDQAKITYTVLEENLCHDPDLWATNIDFAEPGVITFTLHYRKEREDIHLYAIGEHNVSNAVAAAAIACSSGANLQEIAAGLADFRPPDKRMEIVRAKGGYNLLNDTYNANPASMAAGLKALKQMSGKNCAAILGDMLELGETSEDAHYNLGRLIAKLQINHVGLVGQFKEEIRKGAAAGGGEDLHIRLFDEKQCAVDWINELIAEKKLGQDDILLVKASRGLRFETIVQELVT